MISDTQRWYNSTEDVVKALNARGDIDFVIHGGDQSDFGVTKEIHMDAGHILTKFPDALRMPF